MQEPNTPIDPTRHTADAQDVPVEEIIASASAAEPPADQAEPATDHLEPAAQLPIPAAFCDDDDDEPVTEETTLAGEAAALTVFAGLDSEAAEPNSAAVHSETPDSGDVAMPEAESETLQAADAQSDPASSVDELSGDPSPSPSVVDEVSTADESPSPQAAAPECEQVEVDQIDVPLAMPAQTEETPSAVDPMPPAAEAVAEPAAEPAPAVQLSPVLEEHPLDIAIVHAAAEVVTCETAADQPDETTVLPETPQTPDSAAQATQPPPPQEGDQTELLAVEGDCGSGLNEPSDVAPAETVDDALPWRASLATDPAEPAIPDDAVEAQPPAVAFAPGFLAIDAEGQSVPDEAVAAIEQVLNRAIPALAPVKLEPAGVQSPDEIEAEAATQPNGGALWTIPLICLGIAIIACCLLIPQADENRHLVWEREKLRRDLEQIQKQVDVNERFLQAMADDAVLTQRLLQRQMNVVRAGTAVLELDANVRETLNSPFELVSVAPPAPMPEYIPYGGRFAAMCRHPKTQLYLIGSALLLIAAGLVLGKDTHRRSDLGTSAL